MQRSFGKTDVCAQYTLYERFRLSKIISGTAYNQKQYVILSDYRERHLPWGSARKNPTGFEPTRLKTVGGPSFHSG